METNIQKRHTLLIAEGAVTMSGVLGVHSYDDKEVVVALPTNGVTLWGEEFKIEKLDVEAGILEVSGKLLSLKYGASKDRQGLLKKLIK